MAGDPFSRLAKLLVPDNQNEKDDTAHRVGQLGYMVSGVFRVFDEEDPTRYYVRFDDGSFASVPHNDSVPPSPNLYVTVGKDENNHDVIKGHSKTAQPTPLPSTGGGKSVGHHSHARGTGMEYPVDLTLIAQFRLKVVSGLQVFVASGAYVYAGRLKWWGGGTYDLSGDLPATTSYHQWGVLCINPITEALDLITPASSQPVVMPLDLSTLSTVIDAEYRIPLYAIRLKNGATTLEDGDRHSLLFANGNTSVDPMHLRQPDEVTISSGAITVTQSYTTLRTESAAASDDLDTITVPDADSVTIGWLRAGDAAETVILKHGTGNILAFGGKDVTLNADHRAVMYIYDPVAAKVYIIGAAQDSADQSVASFSNPPSLAELEAEFGTAATVGDGYTVYIDNGDAATNYYMARVVNGAWTILTLTKAT